jgi:hypothetical protein
MHVSILDVLYLAEEFGCSSIFDLYVAVVMPVLLGGACTGFDQLSGKWLLNEVAQLAWICVTT